jgi:uncharacterized protein (TIGR02001 family)
MIKSRIAASAALLALAGAAHAGSFSVTPTIASDYDWRGVSQTDPDQDGDVAFQLGGTYSFDNGFYLGAWGSNVDFGPGDPNLEIDYYAGFAGMTDSFGYDVGVNYYSYPGASDGNFFEAYAGISKEWFAAKLWISPKYAGDFGDDPGYYLEANVNYPIAAVEGLSFLAHLGYTAGDGAENVFGDTYMDYSAGVGYSYNNFNLAVKYIDTDIDGQDRGAVVASISTTLPWASE